MHWTLFNSGYNLRKLLIFCSFQCRNWSMLWLKIFTAERLIHCTFFLNHFIHFFFTFKSWCIPSLKLLFLRVRQYIHGLKLSSQQRWASNSPDNFTDLSTCSFGYHSFLNFSFNLYIIKVQHLGTCNFTCFNFILFFNSDAYSLVCFV